ncbi:MAG: thioredoxin family protein [Sedimentisphaerales bacterium]|nr:thioredoxin family protein [Sedimentisphaerales bacterium]
MRKNIFLCACAVGVALWSPPALAQTTDGVEIVRYEDESSRAHLAGARRDGRPGVAVVFEGTDDLHYYARPETAPAPGLHLQVEARADGIDFGKAVFGPWKMFNDPALGKVEVYVGDFTVFVPFAEPNEIAALETVNVEVNISGLACTSTICLQPFKKTLTAAIAPAGQSTWQEIAFEPAAAEPNETAPAAPATPDEGGSERQAVLPYSTGVYYLLAIVAGLSINIMPCVLPVIPLILMRLIEQSKQSDGKRIASGLAFCVGVISFFAAFAVVSAVIHLTTGSVLDLNSLFRYPAAVIVLFLAIVFFGLAMLDVAALSLPSAVTSRQGSGSGVAGSVGMGFFAGILSTPCSGALLGFVLVWAQTQTLGVSSTAIVLMGVGMALPYAVIVLVPSLLQRIPKPGTWMEIFKKSTGFLLFFIAAKLTLAALPKDRLLSVLTYGIIFSFCVWMWSKWVGFSTPAGRKWAVRAVAVALAVGAGLWLLPAAGQPTGASIDWQEYDRDVVAQATAQKRPVLLKFTADWCTNCKIVDRRVYQDPQVAELVKEKNVLAIKADTTLIDYPATTDLKAIYGEAGNVPVTILVPPEGSNRRWRGIFDKQELIDILKSLPEGEK